MKVDGRRGTGNQGMKRLESYVMNPIVTSGPSFTSPREENRSEGPGEWCILWLDSQKIIHEVVHPSIGPRIILVSWISPRTNKHQ